MKGQRECIDRQVRKDSCKIYNTNSLNFISSSPSGAFKTIFDDVLKGSAVLLICLISMMFYRNQYQNTVQPMTQPQSKLVLQLAKEQRVQHRTHYSEELIQDIYNTICKLDPKNLMLVEFLTLIIERDFVRNSNKLIYFVDLYEEFKINSFDQDQNPKQNEMEPQEQKFGKKKFIRMFKEISKKLYPGIPDAYEKIIYEKLTKVENEDHKLIKVDDSIRKMITKETLYALNDFDAELQSVFEIYMPENFNLNLNFNWEEIKILEKKLPIMCLFRFLFEAEVIPQLISPFQFLELVSKLKPPMLPNSGNSKEAMFYTNETMAAYLRDHVHQPKIKTVQGDGGMTFLEFQIFLMRLASELSKDTKGEFVANIRKLQAYLKLKLAFNESIPRSTKFMETVKLYLKKSVGKTEKIVVKKRESRKKIEDLFDIKDLEIKEEASKNIYRNMDVEPRDLEIIRKDLDAELGELPIKKKIDKENNGFFDVDKKHVVIGEQLPNIPEKGKTMPQKDNKKKNEDILLGYRPEVPKAVEESNIERLIQRPKKIRLNNEFPIILNEVFYPSNLNNQLFISPKAEMYLETSYINLGERLYEDAFAHYTKAKANTDSKSPVTQFFYHLHAAQIFESAGRDSVALSFYHKAKQLLGVLSSIEGAARSHPYIGMGVCLYHMDEYQYAYRCFEKAKTIYGLSLDVESIDNAILQNNIGCCLMMLNRNQQAIKFFEVSHNIFDLKVGCFDERTLTVQQNYNKNRKAYLELLPEFKTMWKTYMQKSTTKLPAVKATKQKK